MPIILTQIDIDWNAIVTQALPVVGPIGITLIGLIALASYVIKITAESRVDRQNSKTETTDAINKIATQNTEELNKVNTEFRQYQMSSEKKFGTFEGQVALLTTQLDTERDKRLKEREELKASIRDFSEKLKGYENEIVELKASINGKVKEIEALKLERDTLSEQLNERDSLVERLEHQLKDLQKAHEALNATIKEQSERIQALAKQLASLDPPKSQLAPTSDVLIHIDKTKPVSENEKELSQNSEEKPE